MKKMKRFLTAIVCLLCGIICVGCTSDGDQSSSDGTSTDMDSSSNSGSAEVVVEDVDFSTRETVIYAPENTDGTFTYGGVTYGASDASSFSTVSVDPWEKNVKFQLVVDETTTDKKHGYFNLLASATNGCTGAYGRYKIPGVTIYEDYAHFYNRWSEGSTTFTIATPNGQKVETGVPYEITVGFGNVKKDGTIVNYKIYFKMQKSSGDILFDGIYTLAVNEVVGAPFDYSSESETNTPSLGIGYWEGTMGASHRVLTSEAATEQYVIHYELPSGRTETLEQTEQTVVYGETFQLYVPNITGFEKWVYKDGDKAGEEFVNGVYTQKSDVYLVAVFAEAGDDENQGEFDPDGGFTTPDVPNIGE